MNRTTITIGAAVALAIGAAILSLSRGESEAAAAAAQPMVRIAVLEIDPAQLDAYKTILAEQQEASVRLEPGVLMLHSVAIADSPTSIRLLEVYASRSAYEAHLRSPHFIKYKTSTEKMVKSLELVETTPILLCAKSRGQAGGPVTCM
ncbi:putative quinol monooxygenase [Nonomuraea dietziae]|uniref:putative quinol monooxygenase n=1 Tax=Nonomuraea dietziae TaxID=65515 RepID=UPI0033D9EC5F